MKQGTSTGESASIYSNGIKIAINIKKYTWL